MFRKFTKILIAFSITLLILSGCSSNESNFFNDLDITAQTTSAYTDYDLNNIPPYSDSPYVEINNNVPELSEKKKTSTTSFEEYGTLDSLGRCTYAVSCIGSDLMPSKERDSIGSVKPTGWHISKYSFVDGKYLYNRCHLIGYQLTGENANVNNLITGTRYLNIEGMLPFENRVADYVKLTKNHVYYEVTPIFDGNNLVASGVQMEAKSVEDNGDGILFNVYCFNAQPGIAIDYATGNSHLDNSVTESSSQAAVSDSANVQTYVLNTNTKKFHKESCNSAKSMDASNKKIYTGSRQEIIDMGYEACGVCKP